MNCRVNYRKWSKCYDLICICAVMCCPHISLKSQIPQTFTEQQIQLLSFGCCEWVKMFNFNLWVLEACSSASAWPCLCVSLSSIHRHSPFRQHKTKDKHEIDRMTLTMVSHSPNRRFFFLEIEANLHHDSNLLLKPAPWVLGPPPHIKCTQDVLYPRSCSALCQQTRLQFAFLFFFLLKLQIRTPLLGRAAKHFRSLFWNPAQTLKSLRSATLWVRDQFGGSREPQKEA